MNSNPYDEIYCESCLLDDGVRSKAPLLVIAVATLSAVLSVIFTVQCVLNFHYTFVAWLATGALAVTVLASYDRYLTAFTSLPHLVFVGGIYLLVIIGLAYATSLNAWDLLAMTPLILVAASYKKPIIMAEFQANRTVV